MSPNETLKVVVFWFVVAVPFIVWCRQYKVPSRNSLERHDPGDAHPSVLHALRMRLITKVLADICLLIGVGSAFSLGTISGIVALIIGFGFHLFISDTKLGGIEQ